MKKPQYKDTGLSELVKSQDAKQCCKRYKKN